MGACGSSGDEARSPTSESPTPGSPTERPKRSRVSRRVRVKQRASRAVKTEKPTALNEPGDIEGYDPEMCPDLGTPEMCPDSDLEGPNVSERAAYRRSASVAMEISQQHRMREKKVPDGHMSESLGAIFGQVGNSKGPECDDLEWLNFALKELWPYLDGAVKDVVRQSLEDGIKDAVPSVFKGIHFTNFTFGKVPPVLGPVNVCSLKSQDHPGISFDVGVKWDSEPDIQLEMPTPGAGVPNVRLGITKFTLDATLTLVLRPLLSDLPVVGGVQVFLTSPPLINWEFSGPGLASLTRYPTLLGILREAVVHEVCELAVLPNTLFFHWIQGRERDIDITSMRYPLPEAVVRIGLLEARGLPCHSVGWFGAAELDPYATIRVGNRSHTTPTVRQSSEPQWGEDGFFDFFCFDPGQLLVISLSGAEYSGWGGDAIGQMEPTNLLEVLRRRDGWFPLVKKGEQVGEVRIEAEAFDVVAKQDALSFPPRPRGKADTRAMLSIHIRQLRGLSREFASEATIRVTVEGQQFETNPSWYQESVEARIGLDMQRMIEFMALERYPAEKIAYISGLQQEDVEQIISKRPSFDTAFEQAMYIPINNPGKAKVDMQLIPRPDRKFLKEIGYRPVKLQERFDVSSLLRLPNDNFACDDILTFSREEAISSEVSTSTLSTSWISSEVSRNTLSPTRWISGDPTLGFKKLEFMSFQGLQGPFLLDVRFQLFGLSTSGAHDSPA